MNVVFIGTLNMSHIPRFTLKPLQDLCFSFLIETHAPDGVVGSQVYNLLIYELVHLLAASPLSNSGWVCALIR